jgi:hypothetical protein
MFNRHLVTDRTPVAGTATAAGSGTPGTNLVQDLQAFLHDLFHALRHADRESHSERIVDPKLHG